MNGELCGACGEEVAEVECEECAVEFCGACADEYDTYTPGVLPWHCYDCERKP